MASNPMLINNIKRIIIRFIYQTTILITISAIYFKKVICHNTVIMERLYPDKNICFFSGPVTNFFFGQLI